MQTFLPYPDFFNSAEVLDYRRLGKQRVEAKQILQIILKETSKTGWTNHPVVKMWIEYPEALANYGWSICEEWIKRGYKDTLQPYFEDRMSNGYSYPVWLLDSRLSTSHRSNLLRKDPVYYGKFGWTEPDNLPYFWPTKN